MEKQINPPSKADFLLKALVLLSLVTFNQEIFCQATPTPTPTPSPTASVCPRPTPGTCVSYEAESEDNILTGSAFVLDCPTCSNGFKVGYVGNNSGTLEFDAVGIVVPGRHSLTICYLNGDPVRYALLSVNGNQGMPLTFPSTGSFQTLGSIQTDVVLNTGCNTLEFYNPIVDSWAPDFDRIQFNCPTCALPAPTPAAFFRGEILLGNGVYYLQFPNGTPFGYYSYLTDPRWIYHFDMAIRRMLQRRSRSRSNRSLSRSIKTMPRNSALIGCWDPSV